MKSLATFPIIPEENVRVELTDIPFFANSLISQRRYPHHVERDQGITLVFVKYGQAHIVSMLGLAPDLKPLLNNYSGWLRVAPSYREMLASTYGLPTNLLPLGRVRIDAVDEYPGAWERIHLPATVKWFTPHASLLRQLRGQGLAGMIYQRFLNSGSVGFTTDEHSRDAAGLWNAVAHKLGTRVIYAHTTTNGTLFSYDDRTRVRQTRKLLMGATAYRNFLSHAEVVGA